jgi:16S rRNA (cytidine1402-2'-O)-methyltransferase
MLTLIATPLGNLADITLRALNALKSCDLILSEDTRRSAILLNHYEIKKPLYSYHKFNEQKKEEIITEKLKEGLNIVLISDAGTPTIADPGSRLVKHCISQGLKVESLPGPCALILALTLSGLNTEKFQFIGFLPKTSGRLERVLRESFNYPGTTICYETPHRLLKVLEMIDKLAPDKHLVICRELTKKFEETRHGKPSDHLSYFKEHPLKGEIVLLFESSID